MKRILRVLQFTEKANSSWNHWLYDWLTVSVDLYFFHDRWPGTLRWFLMVDQIPWVLKCYCGRQSVLYGDVID